MKQFKDWPQSIRDIFEDDPICLGILATMTQVLRKSASRAEIPQAAIDAVGVSNFPVAYKVWAGKLEFPWDRPACKAFQLLAEDLRFRYETLRTFVKDATNLGNGSSSIDTDPFALGGEGGLVQEGNSYNVVSPGDADMEKFIGVEQTYHQTRRELTPGALAYLLSETPGMAVYDGPLTVAQPAQ